MKDLTKMTADLNDDGWLYTMDPCIMAFFIGHPVLANGAVIGELAIIGPQLIGTDGHYGSLPMAVSAHTVALATEWGKCIGTGNCLKFQRLAMLLDPVESCLDLWLLKHVPKGERPWN